ncbi:MAG: glycosyltransferase [Planctomycetia bacterium]|nr:glycosyltransferase [Planctomycetia bacterium]
MFLTSCPLPWGGSEELWAGAAQRLRGRGFRVPTGRSRPWERGPMHPRWAALRAAGLGVGGFGVSTLELAIPDAVRRFLPAPIANAVTRLRDRWLAWKLRRCGGDLAVISQGQAYDGLYPVNLPEVCRLAGVPYVLICQKSSETDWPFDVIRAEHRRCYEDAERVFFVSEHNRRITGQQLGVSFEHAEVVRNPFMVQADEPLPWPTSADGVVRLACVARMWPLEKGQDVLLNVLARDRWRMRPIAVDFYGEGPIARGLEEMARMLGLTNARFHGFVDDITAVWRDHHALVLPSRAEGLPLAQVEAMLCGRPVIVAAAGGTGEIVEEGEHGFVSGSATEDAFDACMERAWQRRDEWDAIGRRASEHVRRRFPADPCGDFADRVEAIRANVTGRGSA